MAKIKLEDFQLSELLSYREATMMLYDYYDNIVKANIGDYSENSKNDYKMAFNKTNEYSEIERKIFKEIQNRVDKLK